MFDEDDLVKLTDGEDDDFEIRCKKCGSTEVKVDDYRRYYDSCGTGSLDLVCKKCGATKTLDANDY